MTTATSPEGAKRQGSDTTQTQGCELCTRGDADVCTAQGPDWVSEIHTACFERRVFLKAWDWEKAV